MANSFLSVASKKVTDVRSFLRDAAGGSSIKYMPDKGKKHLLYIPYDEVTVTDDSGNETTVKELIAKSGSVHEWTSMDGKYKATVCLKDVIRSSDDGKTVLNDGTCPFCDRVSDGWEIYNYRKALEEANCKLTGEDREKYLKGTFRSFADERKAKEANIYMYILVVKYRQSVDGNLVIGADGLPEYDLKVMKLSKSRVDKIQQQIANAGAELPGSELIFEYPNTDDRRLLISQSTTAPVFPNNMMVVKYPALISKINTDVAKFNWDTIDKSFHEWSGMTTLEAKKVTEGLFEQWDKYKEELQVNPGARYMEYITSTQVTTPSIGNALPSGQVSQGIPTPGVAAGGAGVGVPNVPQVPNIPDVNAVFGGAAPGIKI